MTKPVSEEHPPLVERVSTAVKGRLEITVAVKNKKGEWETPELNETEKLLLQNAIETIRRLGQQKQTKMWQKLNEEGADVRVEKNGIFYQEGQTWKNLLDDKTIESKTRKEVLSTLKSVTGVVGDLSKTKGTIAAKAEVVIQVHVASTGDVFKKRLEKQEKTNQKLLQINQQIQDSQWKNTLKDKGFSTEDISLMTAKMEELTQVSGLMTDAMREVDRLIGQNKTEEAVHYYITYIPRYYGIYCDAMREWQKEQKFLTAWLGSNEEANPFQVDIGYPGFFAEAANEFFLYAEKTIPGQVDTKSALDEIKKIQKNYSSFLELEDFVDEKVRNLELAEKAFNDQLVQSLNSFNTPEFAQRMKLEGWSQPEIDDYRSKLEALKSQSDIAMQILINTRSYLYAGYVQEGMNYFAEQMNDYYSSYTEACAGLVFLQSLARGRIFEQLPQPFSLDLRHPSLYATFLGEASERTKMANVIDITNSKVADENVWKETLQFMSTKRDELSETILYPSLALQLYNTQKSNLKLTNQIKRFAEAYKAHREQFEFIMRKYGVTDLESAMIFNHYEEIYQALNVWDKEFQHIVDLGNQKKYQEAVDTYAKMINETYPNFVAKLHNANLATPKLRQRHIVEAFKEFTTRQSIPETAELLTTLSSERLIEREKLNFNKALSTALEGHILEEEHFSETIKQAREKIDSQSSSSNQEIADFERLFKQDLRFFQFFTYGNLKHNPEFKKTWSTIIHRYGWTQDQIERFTELYNSYAELIHPLKEAEQAIIAEANPQKKRALLAQLKEIANALIPETQKLKREMEKLGGFKKLQTLHNIAVESAVVAEVKTPAIAKRQLESKYQGFSMEMRSMGFQSANDLIDKLELFIDSLPPAERTIMQKSFQEELALIAEIKFADGIIKEADSLIALMQDRTKYLDKLYTKLGLYSDWEFGSVNKLLLAGPHAQREVFKGLLQDKKWNAVELRKLNTWYDSYMLESIPLVQAKEALDSDPENIFLQKEFKKILKQQIPKLSSLSKELNEKFGGWSRLRELDSAIAQYKNLMVTESAKITARLESTFSETQIKQLNKELEDINTSLKMLNAFKLTDVILKTDASIAESERQLLSWDSEFLKALTARDSSLTEIRSPDGNELWSQFLKENKADVVSVIKLHQKYQNELQRIAELERKLEAHPENERLRLELLRELNNQEVKLRHLEGQYQTDLGKITNVQNALNRLDTELNTILQEIEGHEKDAVAAFVVGKEIHNKEILTLRNRVNGRSNAQIRELINFIQQLNVEKAFQEKQKFWTDTRNQFGKY